MLQRAVRTREDLPRVDANIKQKHVKRLEDQDLQDVDQALKGWRLSGNREPSGLVQASGSECPESCRLGDYIIILADINPFHAVSGKFCPRYAMMNVMFGAGKAIMGNIFWRLKSDLVLYRPHSLDLSINQTQSCVLHYWCLISSILFFCISQFKNLDKWKSEDSVFLSQNYYVCNTAFNTGRNHFFL